MEENQKQKYISLFEAAKLCSYSEPYLRLRARQGKLKSIKLGKKWMTTFVWLDDYSMRVQEWRESLEAKKTVGISAVLVSAPEEIFGVVDRPATDRPAADIALPFGSKELGESPSQNASTVAEALADKSANQSAGTKVQGDMLSRAGNSRLRQGFGGQVGIGMVGQIYPLPKQSPVNDALGYGWFGALLSGAGIALLLFWVARPAADIVLPSGSMSRGDAVLSAQANVSQSVGFGDAGTKGHATISGNFGSGTLEELVDRIARFLNNL